MLPERIRHLVVEGPIGVGKTSLARRLGERLRAELMLEDADANPFLAGFYDDRGRNALPAQLFFLLGRCEQARRLAQRELFFPLLIADFLLDKDPLFARLNLDEAEFRLYQRLHADLMPRASAPDLVIYLQAAPEVLLERVRKRNRTTEKGLQEAYLGELARAYSEFFYHYEAAPLLIVNTERLDFATRDEDIDLLLERIREMRGAREFFNIGV